MKRIFSLFILVVAVAGIVWGTVYTLNHKGIREEVEEKTKQTIEKVTTNETKTSLSEIYNIYLNQEKHKIKINYQLVKKSGELFGVTLYLYFDGKSVLEREVVFDQELDNVSEVFKQDLIFQYVRIDESNFSILKEQDVDYLFVLVGSVGESVQEHNYIINNNGDLMKDEGILFFDSSKEYITLEDKPFLNYYVVDGENYLAQVVENDIYALEEVMVKKKLQLVEYRYYFKKGKLEKEKVQTYEDVQLKVKSVKKN